MEEGPLGFPNAYKQYMVPQNLAATTKARMLRDFEQAAWHHQRSAGADMVHQSPNVSGSHQSSAIFTHTHTPKPETLNPNRPKRPKLQPSAVRRDLERVTRGPTINPKPLNPKLLNPKPLKP